VSAIKDKYYELFCGKGGAGSSSSGECEDDVDDVEAAVAAEAQRKGQRRWEN